MKKFLSVMAIFLGIATSSFSQRNFVATLQHGNDISQYYGQGALDAAYNAAQNGDVITLSSGSFQFSGNFEKGITLRGAGIDAELQTIIPSTINIYSKNTSLKTEMEGIHFSGTVNIYNSSTGNSQGSVKIIKCSFSILATMPDPDANFSTNGGPVTRLYNCVIKDLMYFGENSYPDFNFVNCYVRSPYSNSNLGTSNTVFANCVIRFTENNSIYYDDSYRNRYAENCEYLNFNNCIIYSRHDYYNYYNYILPSTATAYNCLAINSNNSYTGNIFNRLYDNTTNKSVDNIGSIFLTYKGDYTKGETFELTDQAKSQYLGADGTQVGMQGGLCPYSTTVQYPIVTKLEAESHTTKEGLLNVTFEIDGTQK